MLVDMRKRATSWIGWFIIGFLVLGFAFYGITSYLTGGTNPTIAALGGVELKRAEFLRILEQEQQSQRQRFGEGADNFINSPTFKENLARNVVTSRFFAQYVNEDLHMLGSDREVANTIRNDPNFQMDGAFDEQVYRQNLELRGMTIGSYESSLRNQVAMDQLQSGLGLGDFVSASAVDNEWTLVGEHRNGRYVVVNYSEFIDKVDLSDDETRAYYDENLSQYEVPAGFRVAYVRVGPEDVRNQLAITDEDIQAYYEDNKDKFTKDALRSASHILVATNSERDDEAAKARANEVVSKLNAGEDFAALAATYSDDPGSAENGGSLGPIEAGMMVPEFEAAVGSLNEIGETTAAIKTDFGYHVIKLDDITASTITPLDEVSDQIRAQLEEDEIQEQMAQLQTEMANLAYEQSDTLEPVAELSNVKPTQSSWSSGDNIDPIFDEAAVRNALDSSEVTADGYNSDVIELESGDLMVLRVVDSREAAPVPFDQVKDEVRASARHTHAAEMAKEHGEALVNNIEADGFEAAIAAAKREFFSVAGIKDELLTEPHAVDALGQLFKVKEVGSAFGSSDNDGNYIVSTLEGIEPGSVPTEEEETYGKYQQLTDARNVHYNVAMLQRYVDYVVDEQGGVELDLSTLE